MNTLYKRAKLRISSSLMFVRPEYIYLVCNIIVALGFVLAAYVNRYWLFLSVLAYAVNRLGVYLDDYLLCVGDDDKMWHKLVSKFILDGLGVSILALGFMVYVGTPAFLFVVMLFMLYSWKVVIALLRYKIDENYFVDFVLIDNSQVNFLIMLMIVMEYFIPWSIAYSSIFLIALLLVTNIINMKKLFVVAKERDIEDNDINSRANYIKIIDSFFRRNI